jgi:hypothetical protein
MRTSRTSGRQRNVGRRSRPAASRSTRTRAP